MASDPLQPLVDRFPLTLTQPQRDGLLQLPHLQQAIKDRLNVFPVGAQIVKFSLEELRHLRHEVMAAALHTSGRRRQSLLSVQRKVIALLEVFQQEEPSELPLRPRPAHEAETVFQFKVTLLGVAPPIWRRVRTANGTLRDLHECLQAAMGWRNSHTHLFEIDGVRYDAPGPLDVDLGFEIKDESAVRLTEVIPESGRPFRFYYDYDLGDGWRHEILFEGYPPHETGCAYPLCLSGERACPPEDVGGPWGYHEYLEALADAGHPRHAERLAWGGPFDAEAFDPQAATQAMQGRR